MKAGGIHNLTRAQVKRAEKLSDEHTSQSLNAEMPTVSNEDLDVYLWAFWLCKDRERRERGESTPGYTGRNHR